MGSYAFAGFYPERVSALVINTGVMHALSRTPDFPWNKTAVFLSSPDDFLYLQMDDDHAKKAYEQSRQALELSKNAPERERAYVEALARRYSNDPKADRAVLDLCGEPRSVAEVAALVAVPLGVAKVLLGDMADRGMITVHETATGAGDVPTQALMERVLAGLRRL